MDDRNFSIGDRVQVSETYGHNPYVRGKVGTVVEPPKIAMGATPAGCSYVEFDEPVLVPDHPAIRGCAVKISALELVAPDAP